MKFSIASSLATLATVISLTQSAPTTNTLDKRNNWCGDSTFQGLGYPWATVNDCWVLFNNIAGNGDWRVPNTGNWHRIASFGSCGFFARTGNPNAGTVPFIGNEDVRDLVRDSIAKFGGNIGGQNVVGAQGGMSCNGNFGGVGVQWQITNNAGAH